MLENICPPARLSPGKDDPAGLVLTWPFYGYAYNIRNGRNIDYPDTPVPVYT